jgi:phenylacetic acid degradation operon negative regulatory protein
MTMQTVGQHGRTDDRAEARTDDRTEGRADALADLDTAVCSDGAPSARNLLVTVFGDVVAPLGPDAEVTVQELTALLTQFGVNERLVRTSLSRLVNEGLLAVRSSGRRSFYRVADRAIDLFAAADEQIYRGGARSWGGDWTVVVLDGAEATADRRATLRSELAAIGLGPVAPNVLASPIVSAAAAADVIARVGGFDQVLVMRSEVVPGVGLADRVALARRCVDLDGLEHGYAALATRFGTFADGCLAELDEVRATKLRLLVVSTFRRLVLADPMLPEELLPADWAGKDARRQAARLYAATAARSDGHLGRVLGREVRTSPRRFGS